MRELRDLRPPTPELRPADERHTTPERRTVPEVDRVRVSRAEAPRPEPGGSADSTHGAYENFVHAREELARFAPKRCGLPEVPKGDAARYLETHRAERPWLNFARNAPEDVQRVFATLDQGGGHAHIRHEGWLSTEKSQMRVLHMEDPAQLDPEKRARGTDGLLPGDKPHYCAAMSTAVRDPTAFAIAFTCGSEHSDVRAALETPLRKGERPPRAVTMPISDLLGPDGHTCCEGFRLAGDDQDNARLDRRTWLQEIRAGERPSVPSPLLVPVDFRGGDMEFRFKVNTTRSGYEIATMFPTPPDSRRDHH